MTAFCAAAIAAVAWAGIASEAHTSFFMSRLEGRRFLGSLAFFYRYFTNQTITLLAVTMSLTVVQRSTGRGMLDAGIYGSVAVYAVVVCIVYEALLRRLWSPRGLWLVRDALMHDVLPLAALVFWIVFVPKTSLSWADPLLWVIYPALYCLTTFAVGRISGSYPYVFLDPRIDGGSAVFLRICCLALLFCVVGTAFVAVSRLMR